MRSFLLTLSLMLAGLTLLAQPNFEHQFIQYASGANQNAGADFIDYDGDGFLDVLMGFKSQKNFMLFKNVQNTCSIQPLTDSLDGYSYVKTVDINQDGLDDYLVSMTELNSYEWKLYLFVNDGNYQYTPHFVHSTTNHEVEHIEVADLDDDGDLDLVIDVFGNINIFYVLSNNGNNTFSPYSITFSGQPSELYGVADMNGDGFPDVVGAYYNFSVSDYIVVVAETDTSLTPPYLIHHVDTLENNSREGVVANFHGSSLPDILLSPVFTSGAQNTQAYFYQNNGNFNFAAPTRPTVPVASTIALPNDYDNDGDIDALATAGGSGELYLMENTGNGNFNTRSFVPITRNRPIAWRDFNSDGRKDLLTRYNEKMEILLQQPNGTYESFWKNHLVGGNTLQVFDTDNNNTLDVVGFESNRTYNSLQTFDGKFLNTQEYVPASLPGGLGTIRGAFPTDYDQDGDTDVLASFDLGALHWLINTNGTFSASPNMANNAAFDFFERADIDGDAHTDYIGFAENGLRWLEWNGTAFTNTYTGVSVQQSALHDVDSDGDLDIAHLNYSGGSSFGSGKLYYAKNNGSGTFTDSLVATFPGVFTLSVNTTPSTFKKADLDTDGDMDYLILSYGQNKVVWLRNDGSSFTALTISSTINAPNQLVINDFDQDGDLDFIVSALFDFETVLFTNDGSQQFTSSVLDNDLIVDRMREADFDQDGDADVLLASKQQDTYLWLKNNAINCPRTFTTINDTLCASDSILVKGTYFSPPATVIDTMSGTQGCDSISILNLFAHDPITGSVQQDSICAGDSIWFAQAYHSIPGMYHDTLGGTNGCDSVHTLQLYHFPKTTVSLQRDTNDLYVNANFNNYQWYFNGGALAGETNDSLNAHPYGNGLYFLLFEDQYGCRSSSDTLNFIIDDVALLETRLNDLQLYPNPATNEARLLMGTLIQTAANIQLYTLDGKLVATTLWSQKQEGSEIILNLTKLPKGVFLLSLKVAETEVIKKLVHH